MSHDGTGQTPIDALVEKDLHGVARSGDPQEQRRLKEELARMTFGE